MRKVNLILVIFSFVFSSSCIGDSESTNATQTKESLVIQSKLSTSSKNKIRAADISFLPENEKKGLILINSETNKSEDMLTTLKKAGFNYVRIRLWVNPTNGHSDYNEVRGLVAKARQPKYGMKIWITLHYSDTWADLNNQNSPVSWRSLNYNQLKMKVTSHTKSVMDGLNPDIIQIGNEINKGILWPEGKYQPNNSQFNSANQKSKFIGLLKAGCDAVKAANSLKMKKTKIMIHYAGVNFDDAAVFFETVNTLTYDYMGLSYYPIYSSNGSNSGTTINTAIKTSNALYHLYGRAYARKVVFAETAYPFTKFDFGGAANVYSSNVGYTLRDFPAQESGPRYGLAQKNFIVELQNQIQATNSCDGFGYWGGEYMYFAGQSFPSNFDNMAFYYPANGKYYSLPILFSN